MAGKTSPIRGLTWEQFVDDVQGAVWNAIRKRPIKDLVASTRLAHSTITNFADRTTRRPAVSTVYVLAREVLDMRLALIPNSIPTQDYELSMRRFGRIGPKRKV